MKMYLWATCSSSPTQSLEEKDELFVSGIFGNHILIDNFKDPRESFKGVIVNLNQKWIICKPVARVFWYAGHHGHSSHASVPEMKCQENTFWSKIKSQFLRLATNSDTFSSYQNSNCCQIWIIIFIIIIIIINDHLGKPMDTLLRGGRSKRSKDFDLEATLLLRWACNQFKGMISGIFDGNQSNEQPTHFDATWPTIRFVAFSSIFKLIRLLPEQRVSSLKPSSFVEEANHSWSHFGLGWMSPRSRSLLDIFQILWVSFWYCRRSAFLWGFKFPQAMKVFSWDNL